MTRGRARTRASEQRLPDCLDADSALARLLADASAPAQPSELDGLSAALTAFSASRVSPRRSPVKTILASLLATKALAVTAAAASIGGVALAVATGSLPPAAQNAAHNMLRAPAAAQSAATDDESRSTPSAIGSATPSAKPSVTPSPSLVGLCRAYSAGVATANGKALDNPAFTVLISAAGGKDAVTTYCIGVLDAAPGGKPTALPTQAQGHKPSSHPTGRPSSHPTGGPSVQHSGPPTSHPTATPSSRPTRP